jgi:hypothetical protein
MSNSVGQLDKEVVSRTHFGGFDEDEDDSEDDNGEVCVLSILSFI